MSRARLQCQSHQRRAEGESQIKVAVMSGPRAGLTTPQRNEKLQKQADEYEKRKKRREDEREGDEEDVEVIGED